MTADRIGQTGPDRRRFPRLASPVIYRHAGLEVLHHPRTSLDVSSAGMRVLSDESLQAGDRLELDLLPPGEPIRLWARVVWVVKLPVGSPAVYEVGLVFTDEADADRQRLASLLVRSTNL